MKLFPIDSLQHLAAQQLTSTIFLCQHELLNVCISERGSKWVALAR